MRATVAAPALLCLLAVLGTAGCGADTDTDYGPAQAAVSPRSADATSGTGDAAGAADAGAPSSPSASVEPSPAGLSPAAPSAPVESAESTESGRPFAGATGVVESSNEDGAGLGNTLGVTGVRVGAQRGYDRVVFDLDGEGTPGWRVEYVDAPIADGSDDPVALAGTSYLQVDLRGIGMPFETGIAGYGDASTRVSGAGGIVQVAPGTVFEGQQRAYISLNGPARAYRIFSLTNPTRVVVDVSNPLRPTR